MLLHTQQPENVKENALTWAPYECGHLIQLEPLAAHATFVWGGLDGCPSDALTDRIPACVLLHTLDKTFPIH